MTTRPGYVWDNTALEWVSIGPVALPGSTVFYQASAPSSPATGDIWVDADDEVPGITSSLNYRWRKIAAGGETSLSGNDVSGLPLAYNPGYEQVYLNGVLQYRGSDYVATTGNTITGLTALVANDTIEVLSFVTAPIGDTYTQAAADGKFYSKTSSASSGEASTVNINTKPWNMPWGLIGHVIASGANQSMSAGVQTDINNATLTRTFIAGRKYQIQGWVSCYSNAGSPNFVFLISIGGSTVQNAEFAPNATYGRACHANYIYTPSTTASVTVKLRGQFDGGVGGFVLQDGGRESQLIITDIGPA